MKAFAALSSGDLQALAAAIADFDVPGFDFDSGLLMGDAAVAPKSLTMIPAGSQAVVAKALQSLASGEHPMSVHHLEAYLLGMAGARAELEASRAEVQLLWSGPTFSAVPSYDEVARVRQVCRAAKARITFLCMAGDANPRSAWPDLKAILEGLTVHVRFIVGSPPSHREEPVVHQASTFGAHLEAQGILDKDRMTILYHKAHNSAFTASGVLVDDEQLILTSTPCPWSLSETKLSVGVQLSTLARVAKLTALLDAMQADGKLSEVDLDDLGSVSVSDDDDHPTAWLSDLLSELDDDGVAVDALLPVLKRLNPEGVGCFEIEGDDGMVLGACHLFWPGRQLGFHFDENGDGDELRELGWTIHELEGASPDVADALHALLEEEGLI